MMVNDTSDGRRAVSSLCSRLCRRVAAVPSTLPTRPLRIDSRLWKGGDHGTEKPEGA